MSHRIVKEQLLDLGVLKSVEATIFADVHGTKVKINEVIVKYKHKDGSTRVEDILYRMKLSAITALEQSLVDLHCVSDAVEHWDMPDPGAA